MRHRILALVGLLAPLLSQEVAADPPIRPSILLILADDLGYGDLGCYRCQDIPTPHLDALAEQGARLTSFYAQPFCTPSRYSLLTGRHPNRSEGRLMVPLMRAEEADDAKGLQLEETTLAELLRDAGYRTAIIGKWHLGQGRTEFLPTRHGFDHFYGHTGGCVDFFTLRYGNIPDWYWNDQLTDDRGYATDVVTEEAVRILRDNDGRQPFFLYLPYSAPHYAKAWDEETRKFLNVLQAKPQTIERMQFIRDADRRVFAAMVVELDEAVGRILAELRASGHEKNTWVIFASDNGGDLDFGANNDPLTGEKGTLWEGGIRVPCLMRWSGRIPPGTVVEQPVSAWDIFPTVSALLGLSTDGLIIDGIDVTPALLQGKTFARDVFYLCDSEAALRGGDWKYLRRGNSEMLFDLRHDIREQQNLADHHPQKLAALRQAHRAIAESLPGLRQQQ